LLIVRADGITIEDAVAAPTAHQVWMGRGRTRCGNGRAEKVHAGRFGEVWRL
jgi:hypothetical protein